MSTAYDEQRTEGWILLSNGTLVMTRVENYNLEVTRRLEEKEDKGWLNGKLLILNGSLFLWEDGNVHRIVWKQGLWDR